MSLHLDVNRISKIKLMVNIMNKNKWKKQMDQIYTYNSLYTIPATGDNNSLNSFFISSSLKKSNHVSPMEAILQ
jgi:hypothetical protein